MATLGPSTDTLEKVIGLLEAGVNVARLNMSHGDHKQHMSRLKLVRDASHQVGRPVGVFADLQGPKIRLTTFENDSAILEPAPGSSITTDEVDRHRRARLHDLRALPHDVKPGDQILLDDGRPRARRVVVGRAPR